MTLGKKIPKTNYAIHLIQFKHGGFTLIEVIAALTLMTVLISGILPVKNLIAKRTLELELRQNLRTIRNAIDAYHQASLEGKIEKASNQSGYPPNLESLVKGVPNKEDPNGAMIYFLRRIPADPMCRKCEHLKPEETWEARSYQSTVESFSSGRDVFDIRSKSERRGINNVPYKDW